MDCNAHLLTAEDVHISSGLSPPKWQNYGDSDARWGDQRSCRFCPLKDVVSRSNHVMYALISKWRSIWTSLDQTKLKLSSVQQLNINQLDIMNSLRIARTALRVRPTAIRAPLQRRGYAEAVSDKVGIPRQILRPQLTSSRSSCPWLCPIRYVEVFSELYSNT
jgi:hypothetical protein